MLKVTMFAATLLAAAAAHAQTPAPTMPPAAGEPDMMHMMTLAAYNQLGVLQFCQGKGFIGPETIALQQKMIGMLPSSSSDGVAAAEATGKTGVVSFGGTQTSLEDAAKSQNSTVAALCGTMATSLAEAAKSIPQ